MLFFKKKQVKKLFYFIAIQKKKDSIFVKTKNQY